MVDLRSFYKGKRVLVTGDTGFKGAWLIKTLLNFGAIPIGYSNGVPTQPSLHELSEAKDEYVSIFGDVRDLEKLKGVFSLYKPEFVFHLAAQPIVLIGYKEPVLTYETNVMGTVNVLEAARGCPSVKSILNITTDKVYENLDVPNHSFKEEEKLDGWDPYSNSKSCSELVTHSYVRSGLMGDIAVSTARAGNVIGGGDFSPDRIVPDAVRAMESGNEMVIRNPASTRPYQFVLEPLFCYLLLAMKQSEDKSLCGSYNIGPDRDDVINTGDLVSMFKEKARDKGIRFDAHIKHDESAPHEAAFLSLDNSLFKKTFGWNPVWHMPKTIEAIVEWTKAYLFEKQYISLIMEEQIKTFEKEFCEVVGK